LRRFVIVCLAAVGSAQAASYLPSSDELARELGPYLLEPLPSIEKLTGVAIPEHPSPLLVVASFGNDNSTPDLDRGFAIGYTLTELLFDADPKLDVVPPWFYAEDAEQKGAPRGMVRDSTANAYRAAERDHTQWCVHGRISGSAPARVNLTTDGCAPGQSSHARQWTIPADGDWPAALAEMCEYAFTNTAGELTPRAKASCNRARSIRPESFLAFASWVGPKENRAWKRLEAMYAADPKFAPTAVEYLRWLYYDKAHYDAAKQKAFWDRVGEVARAFRPSTALQLMAYAREMPIAYHIRIEVHQNFFVWLRSHSHLSSAWMISASSLADANPLDYGLPEALRPAELWLTDLFGRDPLSVPNEPTHTAALALSLAVYRAWPDSYRSWWQMGYALEHYGWMIRGVGYWNEVPRVGRRGFPVMISWANEFNRATLERHPDAAAVWTNRMRTAKLNDDDDWVQIFERAAEVAPSHRQLYYDAMNYALDQWGGTHALREHIQATAIAKNPDADWAKDLVERYEKYYSKKRWNWLDALQR
jgi:hypothetical protein